MHIMKIIAVNHGKSYEYNIWIPNTSSLFRKVLIIPIKRGVQALSIPTSLINSAEAPIRPSPLR